MTDRTALCSYLHLTSKIRFFEHFSTSVFSQTSRASIKQTTDTKLIWREVHNVDLNKHNMIETLTRRLLPTWHVSFLCGLFLTVKNTFSLSYRWLLSSSLFPLRLLHHQSVWWNPLLTRSSLSFFKVAPKNGFHLLFLGLGLAFLPAGDDCKRRTSYF